MRLVLLAFVSFSWIACAEKAPDCPSTDAGPPPANLCGNDIVDPGEECDDGNPRNGDGCDRECKRESRPECGNGVVEAGETCDDGNTIDFDACGNDCEFTADNNDNWTDAQESSVGPSISAAIFPAGDTDYYRFEGEQGQWLIISTDANPDADDAMVDTVITLYDSDRTRVAQNDNYDSGEYDSRIVIRLPSTDSYYLKVQDTQNTGGGAPRGERSFTYVLKIQNLNLDAEQVNLDTEAGNDAASAQTLDWSERYHYAWIIGGFETAEDVDVYSFSIPDSDEAGDRTQFDMNIYKASASGNGSTARVGRVWITDDQGGIVARLSPENDFVNFSPNIPAGDYKFWVEHPGGDVGANDFYTLLVYRRSDNDPEAEEETNGTLASAETLTLEQNGSLMSVFFLSQMGDGDVDYFEVDLPANRRMSIACRSRLSGSGVVGLTVALHNAQDEEISSDTEGNERIYIRDANSGLTEAGPVYLKLTKESQDPEVSSTFVRCGVHTRDR